MPHEIIIGRNEEDINLYGNKASIFLAKQYIKMGNLITLGNRILLDALRPHVILIAGKRGSGKSYTMGAIAEGLASLDPEIAQNITSLIIDTMGIYWTMKNPNYKDERLLREWGIEPQGFKNVSIFVPKGVFDEIKGRDPDMADYPFSIRTSELTADDWCYIFNFSLNDEYGIAISQALQPLKESHSKYDIDDIIESAKSLPISAITKEAIIQRFQTAKMWGVFDREGTNIEEILTPARINVLDVSLYSHALGAFNLRSLVVGLLAKDILETRIIARREEEKSDVISQFTSIANKRRIPIVWMFIDEVHEFIPNDAVTAATAPLSRVIKEGRQPGIGLIVATQQPGKLNTDVITQADIIISHHITAEIDIKALNAVMQTYLSTQIRDLVVDLPRLPGAAIVLDDNSERIYQVQIIPRRTWHGGSTPTAIPPPKS
ncbi:MAG: ATP-binding protein [Candidatus Rehaiarchaeum fermentans]|nr:ATP-binding protein [Candidatus Rehaiarchaeum fermentans]MCW1302135.1 ATP-binding protein [Candidatus Rehaiarchaeum fermentans]